MTRITVQTTTPDGEIVERTRTFTEQDADYIKLIEKRLALFAHARKEKK